MYMYVFIAEQIVLGRCMYFVSLGVRTKAEGSMYSSRKTCLLLEIFLKKWFQLVS